MFAFLPDEENPAFASDLTASDLVIYEFDQWSNPRLPGVNLTTMCLFDAERPPEFAC
jgi:hypothetical protein